MEDKTFINTKNHGQSPNLEEVLNELMKEASVPPFHPPTRVDAVIKKLNSFNFEQVYVGIKVKLTELYQTILSTKKTTRTAEENKFAPYDILVGRLKDYFGLPFYITPDFAIGIDNLATVPVNKLAAYLKTVYLIEGIVAKPDQQLLGLINSTYPDLIQTQGAKVLIKNKSIEAIKDEFQQCAPKGSDPISNQCNEYMRNAHSDSEVILDRHYANFKPSR